MSSLSPADWLTLIAIIIGPVFGAWFATSWGERKNDHERKMHIFRSLMSTRKTPMSPENVRALNLIDVEFNDDSDVLQSWSNLLEDLEATIPKKPYEEISNDLTIEEVKERERLYDQRVNEGRQRLRVKLVQAMGKSLGYNLEQYDISEGGYYPQFHDNIEWEQHNVRSLFSDLYKGIRGLPVSIFDPSITKDNPTTPTAQTDMKGD